ncbi:hypothetical protein D3C87_1184640 [compost metagenome]
MLVADFTQTLEVTLWWNQHASGTGQWLDEDRRDVRRIVQFDQLQQFVSQGDTALLRHATGVSVACQQSVRQVVDVHHRLTEQLAVAIHATEAGAGDVHTVVTTGTADHFGLGRLAFQTPVSTDHLHRGVSALGARVGEEHVVQVARGQVGDFLGQLKRQRVAVLESWRVIESAQLLGDRFLDFLAGVPGATGPQARQRVIHLAALVVDQPAAFGANDQARVALEVAVGGVRHPVSIELELAGQGSRGVFRLVHGRNLARQ